MTGLPALCLTIPSEARYVSLAGALLRIFCEQAGLLSGDAAKLELAAVEGINNAIEHAYREQAGFEVAIHAWIGEGCLRVEVRDRGETLTAPPGRGMPDPWDERGRGWPLMRACVDRVDYQPDTAGNVLTLTKRLPEPE